jgi:atrial natriuretic peptide receptor A
MFCTFCFQVNNFVGAFHDAVVLYALSLNETIEAGQPISNGTAVTHRMWDRTFNGKLNISSFNTLKS